MPFPNEHAARQTDPGQYDEFRRTHPEGFPAGIDAIFGIKTVEGERVSEIQSLRAAKDKWTVGTFRAWLEAHDFKTTIEAASEDAASRGFLCCDKLIEHLRTAKRFRQDGDRFLIERVRRFDYLGRITFDKKEAEAEGMLLATETDQGFLMVDGKIARTGVMEYEDSEGNRWREYRSADEVFAPEAMASFRMAILTEGHPEKMVTLDNIADVIVGHGGEPRQDGKFLRTSFLITNADAIKSAKDGSAVELSAGYTADVLLEGGVSPDGEEFDAEQTNIRGNHVAKVDKGRCGPECRLLMRGDAAETINKQPKGDTEMKITINGKEIEIPEDSDIAKALMELIGSEGEGEGGDGTTVTAEGDETGEGGGEIEEPKVTKVTTTKTIQNSALQAKIDAQAERIKALEEGRETIIDARVDLVQNARAILGRDYTAKGKSDAEIMRDVILDVRPTLKDRLDAHKGDTGYLLALYEEALKDAADRVDSSADVLRTAFHAHRSGNHGSGSSVVKAYNAHLDHLNGRESETVEGEEN